MWEPRKTFGAFLCQVYGKEVIIRRTQPLIFL
jgi:hypothetical protein